MTGDPADHVTKHGGVALPVVAIEHSAPAGFAGSLTRGRIGQTPDGCGEGARIPSAECYADPIS